MMASSSSSALFRIYARPQKIRIFLQPRRPLHRTSPAPYRLQKFFNIHKPVTDPARQDPDYFEKEADKLPINDHYIDSLKMLWEEKIGSERVLIFKAQDQLVGNTTDYGLPDLDMNKPRLEYRGVDVLDTAPESVRQIFSIGHGQRSDISAAWKKEMMDKVRRDQLDQSSLSAKIAWATATIRHWTALYEDIMANREPKKPWHKLNRRPTWLSYRTYLLINYRRKMLRQLREHDRAQFERVIRELRIAYHVEKQPEHVKTRKAWSEAALKRRLERERERQLSELHEKLKEGREERTAQLDREQAELEREQEQLAARLHELDVFEGKAVANVAGKYASMGMIQETAEVFYNGDLFYKEPRA